MSSRLRYVTSALLFVACLAPVAEPLAQTFSVTAEIVAGCALIGSSQSTAIDFGKLLYGSYPAVYAGDVLASASVSGGGPVRVECTPGLQMLLSVDAGQHAAAGERRLGLDGQQAFVPYGLFTSPGRSTPVGIDTPVSIEVPPTGLVELPIHGVAVLSGLGLMPGTYTDALQITVSW